MLVVVGGGLVVVVDVVVGGVVVVVVTLVVLVVVCGKIEVVVTRVVVVAAVVTGVGATSIEVVDAGSASVKEAAFEDSPCSSSTAHEASVIARMHRTPTRFTLWPCRSFKDVSTCRP